MGIAHWDGRREHWGFLICLPRCRAEKEEELMGFKSCQQSNIKNGVKCFITCTSFLINILISVSSIDLRYYNDKYHFSDYF